MTGTAQLPDLGPALAEGDWAGWSIWTGEEPFETYVGPFYARLDDEGRTICGFRVDTKHLNSGGVVHGGALMTFADYSLFLIAYKQLRGISAVTVSFTSEFLSGVRDGARLIARGDVVKAGRSLVFVRGLMDADGVPAVNFSGVIKIIGAASRAPALNSRKRSG